MFTHSSWAPDRASSYERLEFLGDSVLELAIARQLYERYPEFSEGRLAKIRSHVVSRASCAVVARELGLGERLVVRGGDSVPRDELQRLSRNRNVLAALLEAALGALFLEHGFEKIDPEIVDAFSGRVEYALTTYVDHKTELQEALARTGSAVTYVVSAYSMRLEKASTMSRSIRSNPCSRKSAPNAASSSAARTLRFRDRRSSSSCGTAFPPRFVSRSPSPSSRPTTAQLARETTCDLILASRPSENSG